LPAPKSHPARRFGGCFVRREKWVLSWWARLLSLVLLAAGVVIAVRGAHRFLAVDAPLDSPVLVIEGWVSPYEMTNFVARANYEMIYTTGGPTHLAGDSRDPSDTYASVAYWNLRHAGVPAEKIRMVPTFVSRTDRTYGAALALHEWYRTNQIPVRPFNVVTLGPHARRSRLLHQKAFGSGEGIGVIALENHDYDPAHWWRYSEGVKETLSEGFAYLYARFLFSPD
jgi:uncharacterized SAM-binding protein YcdF (DUF218 family)